MEMQQIVYFRALCDELNFTRAEARCKVRIRNVLEPPEHQYEIIPLAQNFLASNAVAELSGALVHVPLHFLQQFQQQRFRVEQASRPVFFQSRNRAGQIPHRPQILVKRIVLLSCPAAQFRKLLD